MSDLSPKIPNWLDQLQFITFYVMNPCDVPLMAYIETAKPITGEIALVFLQIDFIDFVKQLFKPKWGRSYRHTRRGRRGKRRGGGVPEPSELIADVLDPDGSLKPRRWFLGLQLVAEWIETEERIFWTFFLIEMAQSLIINTIIGVIEANKDACPNIGRMLRTDNDILIGGAGPELRPINVDHLAYVNDMSSANGFGASVPAGTYVVVFCGNVGIGPGPGHFQPLLAVNDIDGDHTELGPRFSLEPGEGRQFVISTRINGPGSVFWRALVDQNFVRMGHVRAFVMQIGN